MSNDDSDEARQARAAQRRRDQDEAQAAGARDELRNETERWRGFLRACAPWGWAFDDQMIYLVGVITLAAVPTGAILISKLFGVSFNGFFDALGPDSAIWFPLAAFALAFLVPFAVRKLATPPAERAAADEEAWMAALPFPPPTLRGAASAYNQSARRFGGGKLRVSLYFAGDDVPKARVAALCEAASIPAQVSTHSDAELRIEARAEGKNDFQVSRNLRLLFHDLAAGVLTPLHEETPIARVELSS